MDTDKLEYYVFEPIARLVEQPESHDFQLQDALEQISNSLGVVYTTIGDKNSGLIQQVAQLSKNPGTGTGTGTGTTPHNTPFLHIAYADDAVGTNFSLSSTGRTWMGIYFDANPTPSQDYKLYKWAKIQGAPGAPGRDGVDGVNRWMEFYFSPTGNGNPDTNPTEWQGTQRADSAYLISQEKINGQGRGWSSVTRIKGNDGDSFDLKGSLPAADILHLQHPSPGDIWISTTNMPGAHIKAGDGLRRTTGGTWANVGRLRGQDGISGKSGLYHSYIYKNTADRTPPAKPTGGAFNGTVETIPTGWTDNPQKIAKKYTWLSHAVYKDNYDGTWSQLKTWIAPVEWAQDGKYFETRFKAATSKPSAPTVAEPVDWLLSPPTPTAQQVIWATTATKHPTGELDTNWSSPVQWNGSDGPAGPKGDQGIPGVKGADGRNTYFHVAYADDAAGAGFSQDPAGKVYIGTYVDANSADSSDPSDYAWVRVQGSQGPQGRQGVAGTNGADGRTSYLHIAYADDANGGGFSQSPTGKSYLGTYVDFVSTDSSDPKKYAWVLFKGAQGAKGDQGVRGTNGANGQSQYLHIAYADTATGGGFSQSPANKEYIGVYVDTHSADSNTASKYTWSLIKGPKGNTGARGPTGHTGPKGNTGAAGAPGTPGTVWVYKEDWNGATPTTAQLTSWFKALAHRDKRNGDVIYLRNHHSNPIKVMAYFLLNGAWTRYQKVIDGDMLVDGDILGKHISAQTTIKVGSGHGAVILNGDHSSAAGALRHYAFLIGGDTPANAVLWMKDNGDAKFNGKVEVGQLEGDVGVSATSQKKTMASHNKWNVTTSSSTRQSFTNIHLLDATIDKADYDRKVLVEVNFSELSCLTPANPEHMTQAKAGQASLQMYPNEQLYGGGSYHKAPYNGVSAVSVSGTNHLYMISYATRVATFLPVTMRWILDVPKTAATGKQTISLGISFVNFGNHHGTLEFYAKYTLATMRILKSNEHSSVTLV